MRPEQFSRKLRDNLFSVFSTLISKHFTVDAFTDMPIHHGKFVIGRSCHMTTCLLDNLTQILYQGLRPGLRHILTVGIQLFHIVTD